MSSTDFFKADIEFKLSGKPFKFSVYHNLPGIKGLSITDALHSWLHRTKQFNAKSFCRYILSKDPSVVAMTEEQWNSLNATK